MKKVLIFIILFYCAHYVYFNFVNPPHELTYMTNKAMFDFSKIQFKKRNLTLSAIGCGKSKEPEKLRELFLHYSSKNELTVNSGRKLLIEITKEFLDFLNKDMKLEKYLSPFPFDFYNIELSLSVYDPIQTGHKYYSEGFTEQKNITYLNLSEGIITYYINLSPDLPLQNIFEEKLEDALNILKENNEI